jgi:hypothetical protein
MSPRIIIHSIHHIGFIITSIVGAKASIPRAKRQSDLVSGQALLIVHILWEYRLGSKAYLIERERNGLIFWGISKHIFGRASSKLGRFS